MPSPETCPSKPLKPLKPTSSCCCEHLAHNNVHRVKKADRPVVQSAQRAHQLIFHSKDPDPTATDLWRISTYIWQQEKHLGCPGINAMWLSFVDQFAEQQPDDSAARDQFYADARQLRDNTPELQESLTDAELWEIARFPELYPKEFGKCQISLALLLSLHVNKHCPCMILQLQPTAILGMPTSV